MTYISILNNDDDIEVSKFLALDFKTAGMLNE